MADYSILLRRLRESYGISDVVLAWITSYLTDHQQSVCHGGTLLAQEYIKFADLVSLIADHCLHSHLYADDTQVYGWSPHLLMPVRSKSACRIASTTSRGGRAATGYS